MLLRCLPRNVDASCHILRRPLPPSAKSATVSSTRHGPSRLSVLHLPLQLFTARDGATYWLRIAISVYPTYIRRPRFGESPSEYCHNVWKKTIMVWLRDDEKNLKIYLFVSTESTNVTDRHTGRQIPHDGISRGCISSRGKNCPLKQKY